MMNMDGATERAQNAAEDIVAVGMSDFHRSVISEGIYHAVVEGGFHSEALTDDEAEFLSLVTAKEGTDGLEDVATGNHPEYCD